MAKRRDHSFFDELFDLLRLTPIWAGPILAGGLFVVFRYVLPAFLSPHLGQADLAALLRPLSMGFAWILLAATLLAWIFAELHKLRDRRLLDRQTGISTIREMAWDEFESLVAEAYGRQGYLAEVVGSGRNGGSDGGVDIELTGRGGERVLVQCKQWRADTVGVRLLRELLGVVVSRHATRGILVTSGRFTHAARQFAAENSRIELVDGEQLAVLIRSVQTKPTPTSSTPPAPSQPASAATPICPACRIPMVRRVAKKGVQAGKRFFRNFSLRLGRPPRCGQACWARSPRERKLPVSRTTCWGYRAGLGGEAGCGNRVQPTSSARASRAACPFRESWPSAKTSWSR